MTWASLWKLASELEYQGPQAEHFVIHVLCAGQLDGVPILDRVW